jgi:hypothetical protein
MEPLPIDGWRKKKPLSIRDGPAYREMLSAAEKVRIQRLSISPQYVQSLQPSIDALLAKHHLAGLVARIPEPTVFFRLGDNTPDAEIVGHDIRVWPWGWPGRFGASVTLSAQFLGSSATCRVAM